MGKERSIRGLVRRLVQEQSSPARLAWAVGVGVAIGVSPFYGFHLAICVVVATLFGLNRLATYLAANISNPFLAPILAFASIQLGSLVLRGRWIGLDLQSMRGIDPWQFGEDWLVGSAILGLVLGSVFGGITFVAASKYRKGNPLTPDPIALAMSRVVRTYRAAGRFTMGFVWGKFRHDPVYRQVAGLCPVPGPVMDFGCGRGQMGLLIADLQPGIGVVGIDWDRRRIRAARAVAGDRPSVSFDVGDIREAPIPPSGCILMLDVLHYNPIEVQDAILDRAVAALVPGGVLLIRDLDIEAGWRARATVWQERFAGWIGLNRGVTLSFRSGRSICRHLEEAGLEVVINGSSDGLPLANVLIEATKAVL